MEKQDLTLDAWSPIFLSCLHTPTAVPHCEGPHVHYRYPGLSPLPQQLPLLRPCDAYVCTFVPTSEPARTSLFILRVGSESLGQIIPRSSISTVWSRRRHGIGFRWAHSLGPMDKIQGHLLKLRAQGMILLPQILG